jgi:hypothetical protein
MQISRMDLADKGSPEGIVMAILKAEPNLPIPVPIEELCRQLDIIEIQALTTQGFEGGLLADRERSRGIILVKKGVSPSLEGSPSPDCGLALIGISMGRGDVISR